MTIQVRSNDPADNQKAESPKGEAASDESKSAPGETAEQKESTESETEETEAAEDGKDAPEEPESEEGGGENGDADKDKPKKKGGFQRRIDKLNARVSAKEQELEYWRNLATKKDAGKANTENVETPKVAADGKPDPKDFEDYTSFAEALADWKVDQKLKERDQAQQRSKLVSEQESMLKTHSERVKLFAEKNEDFMDALENLDDVPSSAAIQESIVSSQHGPEILYELAKNKAEALRISKLSPLAAAREIGKIEAKIAANAPEAKSKEPKKLTNASKPLEPVGKGAAGSVRKSIFDPGLSQSEYEQLRREQIKRKQG